MKISTYAVTGFKRMFEAFLVQSAIEAADERDGQKSRGGGSRTRSGFNIKKYISKEKVLWKQ